MIEKVAIIAPLVRLINSKQTNIIQTKVQIDDCRVCTTKVPIRSRNFASSS